MILGSRIPVSSSRRPSSRFPDSNRSTVRFAPAKGRFVRVTALEHINFTRFQGNYFSLKLYDSVRGRIESKLNLRVSMPPNTSATVMLPDGTRRINKSVRYEFTILVKGKS